MGKSVKAATPLESLIEMAIPLLQESERRFPRTGPGAKPEIPDWVMGTLIMIGILKRRKSKSSQYRFLLENRLLLEKRLGKRNFPARSTYFDRYRRAHHLFKHAMHVQSEVAIEEGIANPEIVAVDKSLIDALGPQWHKSDRDAGRIPKGLRGVDVDATWAVSQHTGWVQGYGYEVIVCATAGSVVFPLCASVDTASVKENHSFALKIDSLPEQTEQVTADMGYDSNELADRIELGQDGKPTGRKFVCPPQNRHRRKSTKPGYKRRPYPKKVQEAQARRQQRISYYRSRKGKRAYARRGKTVEPFHEWFQSLFELKDHVWHRHLDNNRTQMLAALFSYQLLLRYNAQCGNENGQVRWILDAL